FFLASVSSRALPSFPTRRSSDLLTNFAFSRSRVVRAVFGAIERLMIRRSRVVIVICAALEETVRAIDPQAQTVLIENAPGSARSDRKSTRLNSSHVENSYAVFCL